MGTQGLKRYFVSVTHENNMLVSQVKKFPLLWLYNPLALLLYDRNIIGSSSEIFLGKCSETFVWPSDTKGF